MKTFNLRLVNALVLLAGALTVSAQENAAPSEQAITGSSTASQKARKLPYGVADVLKLTRSQVSEDVIINYVENSGTVYNLSSDDVLYLRNEGVSDRVVSAMLEQRRKLTDPAPGQESTSAVAPQTPAAPPAPQSAPAQPAQPSPAPAYVQPPTVQTAPSTVYVIPYPAGTAAYYGYYRPYSYGYPYYGAYYGRPYWGPSISLGFGFGGHWGGGYRGHWGGGHWGGGHWGGHHGHH